MRYLGVDYGKSRIGIALAESTLAEPLTVLSSKNNEETIKLLSGIIHHNSVEAVVIGVSEGTMAAETRKFATLIRETLQIPVFEADETLSSIEAQKKLIEKRKSPRKRKKAIDAAAAAIILQSWLDSQTHEI